MNSFTDTEVTQILKLKSAISSYYNLQMKKLGDNKLSSLLFSNCIITGGCIASLFHNEPVSDIDVYAKHAKDIQAIKHYIIDERIDIVKTFEQYELDAQGNKVNLPNAGQKAVTDNAVTLTNDVQFIYLGEADDCRAKFDFIHCMPWFDIGAQKLHISRSQFDSIRDKRLVVNPGFNTEAVKDRRIQKYTKRGWGGQLYNKTFI